MTTTKRLIALAIGFLTGFVASHAIAASCARETDAPSNVSYEGRQNLRLVWETISKGEFPNHNTIWGIYPKPVKDTEEIAELEALHQALSLLSREPNERRLVNELGAVLDDSKFIHAGHPHTRWTLMPLILFGCLALALIMAGITSGIVED